MARPIWNGAITFGLVHLPVGIYPATHESSVDFQWLDRRTLDPVGYRRYNKRTGRELKPQDIVKGVEVSKGRYVVVSDAEIRAAFPRTTQTIAISSFLPLAQVPLTVLERPYYLAPAAKAAKVYALLRDCMAGQEVAAIARLVIHNKEHLAVLIVIGEALVLEIARWPADLRSPAGLGLPGKGGAAAAERRMATQLITQMTGSWKPSAYHEHFGDAIRALVKRKAASGRAAQAPEAQESPPAATGNVIDLTRLLADSLRKRRGAAAPEKRRSAARAR